jgi:hypothetical protein
VHALLMNILIRSQEFLLRAGVALLPGWVV